jgi:hypothetical protein
MAEQPNRAGSWWLTLPGFLTGAAALLTAVTGLILAFHQIGWLGGDASGGGSSTTAGHTTTPSQGVSAENSGGAAVTRLAVGLPGDASFRSGTVAYTVVRASAAPAVDGRVTLSFTIRAANFGRYDLNFWDDSFRVLAGPDSYAPTSGLDDVVHADATDTGQVTFLIRADITRARLKIRFAEGDKTVPFTIRTRSG